ncbi:unnamed protein product [Caenorhabditis angaria]|uniref:Uncharacterized protein n=1 Tax=Caenorhabditis angaria TaxID=860376 RepID=A0A9P1NA39_9PELO|nr:unnamed protein product [Caenorhabditis angaria]
MEEQQIKRKKKFPENIRILVLSSNNSHHLISNLSRIDSQIIKLRNSTYNPVIFPTFEQLLDAPSLLNLAEKLKPMPNWPLAFQKFREEQVKLNEISLKLSNQSTLNHSLNSQTMTFAFTSIQYRSDCFRTPDGCFLDSKNIIDLLNTLTGKNVG